jgi:pimeloyl-ACP methyl ester carboxylesterase
VARTASAVEHVRSRDGTPIGYQRIGSGPPLVILHGATSARWSFDLLIPHLVEHVTAYAVDRRGRGASGDGASYAIEREFEDIAVLVASIPEPAVLFGHSYGATVALGTALLVRDLRGLVLYEPAPGFASVKPETVEQIERILERGEPEEALVFAYLSFGFTHDEVETIRGLPTWPARVEFAHSVPREVRAEAAYSPFPEDLRKLEVPTLFLLGGESPAWAREGTERIHAELPTSRIASLPGQGHMAHVTAPELVAAELLRFLSR